MSWCSMALLCCMTTVAQAVYSEWGRYSQCNINCQQIRSRTCTGNCQNAELSQTISCKGDQCPRNNSVYGEWGSYSQCNINCQQIRSRTCTENCQNAEISQTISCEGDQCPPTYVQWSGFSVCSSSCIQSRSRECLSSCGNSVLSERVQTQGCTGGSCVTTPVYGEWGSYSQCNTNCEQIRRRTCTENCQNAELSQTISCEDQCPPVYGEWGSYSQCNINCQQIRNRTCTENCQNAEISQTISCEGVQCPPTYVQWSGFSVCSSSCTQSRSRECLSSCGNSVISERVQSQGCTGGNCVTTVVCSQQCNLNATCTSPDNCTCNTGFHGNGITSCEPVCSTTCHRHATCTSPDTCTCNTGYEGNGTSICNLVCSQQCHLNATCTSPNNCTCNNGFHGNGITSCEPVCSTTCHRDATCTSPDTCTCNTGYEGNGTSICNRWYRLQNDVQNLKNAENRLELHIVTLTSCGISLACLFLTVLTHSVFPNIRKTLVSRILMCHCISLIGLLISFLVGAELTEPRIVCQVEAGVIHFFTLSSFCWVLVHAAHLYRSFALVYNIYRDKNVFTKVNLICWGVPAIIVIVTRALRPEDLGNDKICMIRGDAFYFSVVLPVCLILLVNFILLGMTMHSLIHRAPRVFYKRQAKIMALVFSAHASFLGLSWLFGLLAVWKMTMVFQWIFCVTTSLQGIFIFMFHTIRNHNMKIEWIRYIRRNTHQKDTPHSPSVQPASNNRTDQTQINMKSLSTTHGTDNAFSASH